MKYTLGMKPIALLAFMALFTAWRLEAAAPRSGGTIAYVRDGKEIRLIEPDGSNDRLLWRHPQPDITATFGTAGLAWRPDGGELAFASGHEAVYSFYESDLNAIRPDGSGLRRLTNPPAWSELGRFPKGSVVVSMETEPRGVAGPFVVYVVGAGKPQTPMMAPGTSQTLKFDGVADLGDHPQPVVAMYSDYRWSISRINIRAGQTVKAPTLRIIGRGSARFGAYRPAWRSDGTEIGYILADSAGVWSVPAHPSPGSGVGHPLGGTDRSGVSVWDWGPAGAHADHLLCASAVQDKRRS